MALEDDRQAWPAYQAAPVVSDAFAKKVGPDFDATVNHVSSLLDAATMRKLNAEVDEQHEEPAAVAKKFLEAHGLES